MTTLLITEDGFILSTEDGLGILLEEQVTNLNLRSAAVTNVSLADQLAVAQQRSIMTELARCGVSDSLVTGLHTQSQAVAEV